MYFKFKPVFNRFCRGIPLPVNFPLHLRPRQKEWHLRARTRVQWKINQSRQISPEK